MKNEASGKEERRTKLAKSFYSPRDPSCIPAVQREKQLEPEACDAYVEKLAEEGFQVTPMAVGFIIHPSELWAGASPDRYLRIVNESTAQVNYHLLEVKTFAAEKTLAELPYLCCR